MKKTYKYGKRIKNQRIPVGLYVSIAVLLAIIITAVWVIVSNNRENANIAATGARLFFLDSQSNNLKPEYRQLPDGDSSEKVRFVLEELVMGPKSAMMIASVPADIIKSATISGTNVDVSVSSNYRSLRADEELLCRAAIVYSLTDLAFVETATINVEGNELLKTNGQPFGKIRSSDIVMSPVINPQGESPRTLTLYFADESSTGLVAETRVVSVNPNETLAKYIVNELIKGPEAEGLLPTVPRETKLLKIDVIDGVCSVDLSRDFINKHTGAPGTEKLTIYSIVNSLCELSDIKNVQFLIENRRQEEFKSETGFNNLYEAKEMPPAGVE